MFCFLSRRPRGRSPIVQVTEPRKEELCPRLFTSLIQTNQVPQRRQPHRLRQTGLSAFFARKQHQNFFNAQRNLKDTMSLWVKDTPAWPKISDASMNCKRCPCQSTSDVLMQVVAWKPLCWNIRPNGTHPAIGSSTTPSYSEQRSDIQPMSQGHLLERSSPAKAHSIKQHQQRSVSFVRVRSQVHFMKRRHLI